MTAFLRRLPAPWAAVVLLAGLAPARPAQAAETYFNLRISASACEPRLESQRALVRLSGAAWVFDGASTGTVALDCPVHRQSYSDFNPSSMMQRMRVWYRDPDGTGSQAGVTAFLRKRNVIDSVGSVIGATFDSSDHAITTDTRQGVNLAHNASSAIYTVRVNMQRASSSVTSPRFTGIDFTVYCSAACP